MKLKEPEVIYKGGKPTAVILPLAAYEELIEQIEDAEDVREPGAASAGGLQVRGGSRN